MVFLKSVPSARIQLVLASILLSLFVLNTPSAAQQVSTQQPSGQKPLAPQAASHKRPAKAAKKPAPDPPPPAPPPPPPTLEQMPASPPQVRYSQGQLTIVAENSTLADILRAVRTQTGAALELPPNANERVVAHLGPGPARDVLAALLNGTHFNYVMVGSPAHPDSVERLILTPKSGGDPGVVATTPAPQSNEQVQMDDAGSQATDVSEQSSDDATDNSASGEPPQPQPNPQPVKTPEQMLHELQQQQQIQQQQQQAPPAGTPPPQGGPN